MDENELFPNKAQIFGQKIPSVYNLNANLGHLILSAFKMNPNHVVQINADTGMRTTCYEMQQRIEKIATALTNLGYGKGDIVAVMGTNSEYISALAFACFAIGMPINFLSPTFNKDDIVHMLGITCPKVVFCDANFIDIVEDSLEVVELIVPIYTILEKVENYEFLEDLLEKNEDEGEFIAPDLGDISELPAVIMCSSGTTGLSKGVALSHAICIQVFVPFWTLPKGEQEIAFNFATLYWITGLQFMVTAALYNQTRVFTRRTPTPELLIEVVQAYNITLVLSAPFFLATLNSYDALKPLPSIRSYMCGGSVLNASISENALKFLPNGEVRVIYGATEVCGIVTVGFPDVKYGSAGRVMPNIDVKIIDDDGTVVDVMEHGEVCIRTRFQFLGYYKNPVQTEECLDSDGWFHTGDIGYFDEDGFVYVIDRKKDILKYQGFHVSPSELEAIISKMDLVETAVVVGIQDELGNDIIYAFVKRRDVDVNQYDILDFVHRRVIDSKKIRGGVFFIDEIPLTSSGKVLRRKVKEMAQIIYNNSFGNEIDN